jgi:hypothetical protein
MLVHWKAVLMAEMKAGQTAASLEYWMAGWMASSSGLRSAVKKVDVLARLSAALRAY